MRRKGNVLILSLVACGLLALVLVVGVEVASLSRASHGAAVAGLQMEQLHRTAVADALDGLNTSGDMVSAGRVLLSDTPVSGQQRQVTVTEVEGPLVTLRSESRIDDGSRRSWDVQCVAVPVEERLAFAQSRVALFHAAGRAVEVRWLRLHEADDLVIVCSGGVGQSYGLGSSGSALTLAGSLYAIHLEEDAFTMTLRSDLTLAGNAVFRDNLQLLGNLSCQEAWIDGTLKISEGARLSAECVVLGEDVDAAVLDQIDAAVIYMPHPPEQEDDDEEAAAPPEKQILPLAELARPAPERVMYLMLQQLDG